MALIEWTENLSVGVPRFDAQHRELVQLINDLHSAMVQGKGRDVSTRILGELIRYVGTHFGLEEQALETHGFPGLAQHRAEHEKLTTQVLDYKRRLDAGEIAITVGLLNFLRDWLVVHIQQTDAQYASFFRARGVV